MLALFGLKKEDLPDEVIDVLPDNWKTFVLFDSMSTQWRVGGIGATGLDYSVIPLVAKSLGFKRKDISEILPYLRVMEAEALTVMIEERNNN